MNKRTQIQKNLARAIAEGTSEPVYFGKFRQKKLAQINALRKKNSQTPITSNEIYIYVGVILKLRDKRIYVDHLTPYQVADIAYSAVHNRKSRVLQSKYPHIQVVVKTKEGLSYLAFISEHKTTVSLKSTYPVKNDRVLENICGTKKHLGWTHIPIIGMDA